MRLGACVLIGLLLSVSMAMADQAETYFTTPDGFPVLRVTISHPTGEVTRELFEALRVEASVDSDSDAFVRALLEPELLPSIRSRNETGHPLGELDKETREWVVDWSGVTVRLEPLDIAACEVQTFTTSGKIRRNESAFFQVAGFTATVGSLNVKNRDADLHAYDQFGNWIASSRLPASSHRQGIPDGLWTLNSTCSLGTVIYEVEGMKKKPARFHLSLAGFGAI